MARTMDLQSEKFDMGSSKKGGLGNGSTSKDLRGEFEMADRGNARGAKRKRKAANEATPTQLKQKSSASDNQKPRKRRVEEWDDEWVDPQDDIMWGFDGDVPKFKYRNNDDEW